MSARPARTRRTQAERRAETRAALLENACRIFGEKGYADTSVDEIAAACGLTVRPVYHYFGGKQGLFEAVNDAMEERIIAGMQAAGGAGAGEGAATLPAWSSFLELCGDPGFRRIVLLDAPSVLGRARWSTSAVTRAAIDFFRKTGGDEARSRLEARILVGALGEAGLAIAESDDPEATSRATHDIVKALVRALGERRGDAPDGEEA